MRTRALNNKLSRLEARFPLRFAKRDNKSYPLTIEESCSALSYLLCRLEGQGHPLPADVGRVIAEFEGAHQQGPVSEALTQWTWEVLTGFTTLLLQAWGHDVGPPDSSNSWGFVHG